MLICYILQNGVVFVVRGFQLFRSAGTRQFPPQLLHLPFVRGSAGKSCYDGRERPRNVFGKRQSLQPCQHLFARAVLVQPTGSRLNLDAPINFDSDLGLFAGQVGLMLLCRSRIMSDSQTQTWVPSLPPTNEASASLIGIRRSIHLQRKPRKTLVRK